MIEPRTAYERDRTWCCWRVHDHPFGPAVAARWTEWDVAVPGRGGGPRHTVRRGDPRYPYEMLPADRVYAIARNAIAAAPHVDLCLGRTVLRVAEHDGHVEIETNAGFITADLAFDTRPPPPSAPDMLAQVFLGQEIETDRPVFEPGRVTLMDFAVPQLPGAVRFLYCLPVRPNAALVEDTWFAPANMALPDGRDGIRAYLAERYGVRDYAVRFEETGAIPMDPGLQAPTEVGRVIPLGTAGGAVKPSSGYAFLAIQRMADAYAAALAGGEPIRPVQPRSARSRWMDEVFLRAIRRRPADAPRIFASLFERAPPGALVRFLSDTGSTADTAHVIAATPKLGMIAAAAGLWAGR